MTNSSSPLLLVGDIGGTKTVLSTVTYNDGVYDFHQRERFSSQEYHSLEEVLRIFLRKHPLNNSSVVACFALAGPINDGYCQITNLPWNLRDKDVKKEFGFKSVTFINDFEAIGYSVQELEDKDLLTLQKGEKEGHGPIAIIGAGTGLGEAFLTYSSGKRGYIVHPSEGGHSSFSPRNEMEIDFLRLLLMEMSHVDYDVVLSGSGLVRMYNYLLGKQRKSISEKTQKAMRENDPASVISEMALAEEDLTAERALDMFVCIYGAEASNLAAKVLATGGVYVAGGIAPKIVEKLKGGRFMKNFLDKGRHHELLQKIPVNVVLNEETGLVGAATIARRKSR